MIYDFLVYSTLERAYLFRAQETKILGEYGLSRGTGRSFATRLLHIQVQHLMMLL